MNWFKQNKGLAFFLLVATAGSVFLGYRLLGARSRMTEALEAFDSSAQELNRLRSLSPFPEKKNLEKVQAQQQELSAELEKLRSQLRGNQIPLEAVTEVEFQDRLKETVERISASAAKEGVALPEKFYLGFDQYQAAPPKKDAAPHLARQLKSIEWAVAQLIAHQVKVIERVSRDSLPEEGEKTKSVKDKKNEISERGLADRGAGRVGRADAAAEGTDPAKKEILRNGFELSFRSTQDGFQKTLNAWVGSKTHFYIPTRLEVHNEKENGPSRDGVKGGGPAAEPAGGDAPPADKPESPAAPAAKPAGAGNELSYIVGEELVVVDVRLEVVQFADPKGGSEEPKTVGGRPK